MGCLDTAITVQWHFNFYFGIISLYAPSGLVMSGRLRQTKTIMTIMTEAVKRERAGFTKWCPFQQKKGRGKLTPSSFLPSLPPVFTL